MSFNVHHVVNKVASGYINELLPGCKLQLQFSTPNSPRVVGKLIGYDAGRFILVRLLDPEKLTSNEAFIHEQDDVVVRLLLEGKRGECLAFKTRVMCVYHAPVDMIYLYFPSVIEQYELRTHPRVPTCIEASIIDAAKSSSYDFTLHGCISDVSLGGCRFEFVLPANKHGIDPRTVIIGAGDRQTITAEIRNQRLEKDSRISVGMKFNRPVHEVKQILSNLYISPEMLVRK